MPQLTNNEYSSIVSSTGRESQAGSAVLGLLMALLSLFSFLFLAASAGEALLLRSVVGTRFQFVVLTGVAVEVKDFLRVLTHNGCVPTVIRIGSSNLPLCAIDSWTASRPPIVRSISASPTAMFTAPRSFGSDSTRTPTRILSARTIGLKVDFQPAPPRSRQICIVSPLTSSVVEQEPTSAFAHLPTSFKCLIIESCCRWLNERGANFCLSFWSSSVACAARALASAVSLRSLSIWVLAAAMARSCASRASTASLSFSAARLRAFPRAITPVTTPTASSTVPINVSQNVIESQRSNDDWNDDILLLVQIAGIFYGFLFMALRAYRKNGNPN
jgi:hypothetical protein